MNLEERIRQLRQAKTQTPGILVRAGMNVALQAVEEAVEETPPTVNSLCGTNTRTREMKQHWVADSRPRLIRQGGSYMSKPSNGRQYTPSANDGYRMGRHPVPGPAISPDLGLLEFDLDGTNGIAVGTRTTYVPDLFMVDKAAKEYRRVLREGLEGLEELTEWTRP